MYGHHGDDVPVDELVGSIRSASGGGTLAVHLANDALTRGYRATIHTWNVQVFDPTWFAGGAARLDLRRPLAAQRARKRDPRVAEATEGYLRFLELGGEIRFDRLDARSTAALVRRRAPLIAGLSATYLYDCSRELGATVMVDDDLGGEPQGHFVVLTGHDEVAGTIQVADPLRPNPFSDGPHYDVDVELLFAAVLLGVVTYDANLLWIRRED